MALASELGSDDKIPQSGTALTAVDDTTGIAPFVAMADETPRPRGLRGMMLDYSAHAAMIVGLIGFAWTVSDHVVNRPATPAAKPATLSQLKPTTLEPKTLEPKTPDAMADLRASNMQMAQDIKALRANLDALRNTVHQDRTPEQVRALSTNLETVKSGLTSTKSETSAALAQLTGKMEKLQRETSEIATKTSDTDHTPKVERQAIDTSITGSLPTITKVVPTPPVKPQTARLAQLEEATKSAPDEQTQKIQPQIISGYVVRDVYDGVALIEGRHGPIEVVPGVGLPGAGVVKSIDRHGAGWTVTTTKGLVAYAAPTREPRRATRAMYPAYRDDF